MEFDERELRDDELGHAMAGALRQAHLESEVPAWRDVTRAAAKSRRRRRTLMATSAAAAAVLVLAGTIALVRDADQDRHIATDRERTIGVAPPSVGPNPALTAVKELPTCSSAGDLAQWSRSATAPYGEVAVGQPDPIPLVNVTYQVPVLANPQGATCTFALQLGDAWAWEARNGDGEPVARFVAGIWPNNFVPARMLEPAHAGYYHQEWLASGQGFNGFIQDSDLEALVRLGDRPLLVIGNIPGVNAKSHAAGVTLLNDLYAEPLVAIPEQSRHYMPTLVPVGFGLCSFVEGAPPSRLIYCDARGRALRLSSSLDTKLEPPQSPTPITVKSFQGVAGYSDDGQRQIDLNLGANLGIAHVTASPEVALDDLTATLGSIPFIDPRLGQYRVGSGDSRQVVTEEGLRQLVERNGGTAASVAPSIGGPAGVLVVNFTGPFGEIANAIFKAVPDDEDPQVPPGDRIAEVGTVDFSVVEKTLRHPVPSGGIVEQRSQQLYGVCNRVFINVMMRPVPDDQAIEFTRGIVADLGC